MDARRGLAWGRVAALAACLSAACSGRAPGEAQGAAGEGTVAPRGGGLEAQGPQAGKPAPLDVPFLTEREYRRLHPRERVVSDLDGDGLLEELLVVPFRGDASERMVSVGVVKAEAGGHRSQGLLELEAEELRGVWVLGLGGGSARQVVVAHRGGSGGFLTINVFAWDGRRYRSLPAVEGVYQGRFRLARQGPGKPYALFITRAIAGPVNAFPRGDRHEEYRWSAAGFVRVSRASPERTSP
jgi:hypothetical protein